MSKLKKQLSSIILNNSYRRTENLDGSIILKKDIFLKLLNDASEQSLKSICLSFDILSPSYELSEFGPWLEANRRILSLTQSEFGTLVGATQAEISNIENCTDRASYTYDRAKQIEAKVLEEVKKVHLVAS